jgi:hypothetical protein
LSVFSAIPSALSFCRRTSFHFEIQQKQQLQFQTNCAMLMTWVRNCDISVNQ